MFSKGSGRTTALDCCHWYSCTADPKHAITLCKADWISLSIFKSRRNQSQVASSFCVSPSLVQALYRFGQTAWILFQLQLFWPRLNTPKMRARWTCPAGPPVAGYNKALATRGIWSLWLDWCEHIRNLFQGLFQEFSKQSSYMQRVLTSQKIKNFDAWALQCNEFNSRRRCAPEIGGTRKFSVMGSWTALSWSAWCFAINFMTTFASWTQSLGLGLLRSTCGWTVQAGQTRQSLIDCCVHRCDVSRSAVECQEMMS